LLLEGKEGINVELRAYAKILWRRLWIIALVVGVVTIYIAYDYFNSAKIFETARTYQTTVNLRIGLPASAHVQDSTEYTRITENLSDEFATGPLLTNSQFNTQVVQEIAADKNIVSSRFGANANLGAITIDKLPGVYKVKRIHNMVTISVDWGTEAGAWAIAHAVGQVCEKSLPTYLNYNVAEPAGQGTNQAGNVAAVAKMISEPEAPIVSGGNVAVQRKATTLALLFLVGLIIGIALAFLVEYLDDRIREPDDLLSTLQLPIYGTVPHVSEAGQSRPRSQAEA
jgi:capsular polysaccharide biosynthesis protein